MRRHGFYSHWCSLLEFHLKRRRMSVSKFAEKSGRSQQAMASYITGRVRPPLDQVPLWAAQLGLNRQEKDQFLEAAYEAWTPEAIWNRLISAEAKSLTLQPLSDTEAKSDLLVSRAIIASLVVLLKDLEALFYDRTVAYKDIATKREALGEAIRAAIVQYDKPPTARLRDPPPTR